MEKVMEYARKYLPHAFKATDINELLMALIIYLVLGAVGGLVLGLLAKIPFIGFIFGIAGSLVGLYCLIGIVLSVLVMLKIVK